VKKQNTAEKKVISRKKKQMKERKIKDPLK
jgi:hypothetical protein